MLFSFTKELFEVDDNIKILNKIWYVHSENHRFFQSDIDDIEATEQSQWFQELNDTEKTVYQTAIAATVNSVGKKTVDIGKGYTPEEAWHFLLEPVRIILENGVNDAPFLHSLFRCFKQDSKQIVRKIENRLLTFEMGGGSGIRHTLEGLMNGLNIGCLTKPSHEYLRSFVIIDSDKSYPNEELKQGAVNLINFLEEHGINYHVLEKREMENYLPNDAYDDVACNREFIDAYLRLTPEQQDYFDLEKGLPDINFDRLPNEIQSLFEDVSSEDKKILRKNDLRKFTGSRYDDFKSNFPKLFHSAKVTKARLIEKTKHQTDPLELTAIINKVRELL